MPRQDLTEPQIRTLRLKAQGATDGELWSVGRLEGTQLLQLIGELQALREREAASRFVQQIEEGPY